MIIYYYFIFLFNNKNEFDKISNGFTNSNLKVCLCLVCKQENLYIKYFVDIYKKLGFNHIFLYDNNDNNGEYIEDVIPKEIRKNFISIIRPQMAAYYDCYEKNNLFYDWIAFFDVDEYLILNPSNLKLIGKFLQTTIS